MSTIDLAVMGYPGRMALSVERALGDDPRFALTGLAGRQDVKSESGAPVTAPDALPAFAVLIDFSLPEGAAEAAALCVSRKAALVTGTTGLSAEQQAAVREAAKTVPVVQAGNFSTGITVLSALAEKTATLLGEEFDVEIAETHHRRKKDAPSGTALLLGEAAARGRGTLLSEAAVFSRHGRSESRAPGEIGFAVRRGGGVYGDHEVAYMGEEEMITLSHRALGRDVFARGALRAAAWAAGQKPGLYGMRDVLGLEGWA